MEDLIGWRILSSVDEIQPGKSARARAKAWKSDYDLSSLMLEMMAQTAGLVVGAVKDFQTNLIFAKIESAEFANHACPPWREPLTTNHELLIEALANEGVSDQGSWMDARVICDGHPVASARLFLIDAGDLNGSGKSVTFHEEFLHYYQIRQKIIDRGTMTVDPRPPITNQL